MLSGSYFDRRREGGKPDVNAFHVGADFVQILTNQCSMCDAIKTNLHSIGKIHKRNRFFYVIHNVCLTFLHSDEFFSE